MKNLKICENMTCAMILLMLFVAAFITGSYDAGNISVPGYMYVLFVITGVAVILLNKYRDILEERIENEKETKRKREEVKKYANEEYKEMRI